MNRCKNWKTLFEKYLRRALSVLLVLLTLFPSLMTQAYESSENEKEEEDEAERIIVSLLDIEIENYIETSEDKVEEIIHSLPTEVKVLLSNGEEAMVSIAWNQEESETEEEDVWRYRMTLMDSNDRYDESFSEDNIPYFDIVIKEDIAETQEEEAILEDEIYSVDTFDSGGTTWTTFNEGGTTLGNVIGINRGDLLSWLGKHVNDTYYLSTPYKGGDYRNPNGDPAGYGDADTVGVPAMNCTGFVWHALTKAGANSSVPALKGWYTLLVNNKIEYRTYYNVTGINDCLNTILTDGYIEPGDLIWTWDSSCAISSVTGMPPGTSAEHHIGIYIGKYFDAIKTTNESGEFWQTRKDANRWWHSSDHGLANNFDVDGNQTSLIMPKTACSAVTVIKMGSTSSLTLQKVSSNKELTDDNSYYSLENAQYGVYTDVECTDQIATLITDSSGTSNTVILAPNKTYYIKEIAASTGYELDTKIYSVWLGSSQTFTMTVKETPKSGKLILKKVSSNPELTENNENYSLEGAVYGIYTDVECTELVDTLVTEVSGNSNEVELTPARIYYIKEITAPKGFEVDTKIYSAWMTVDQTVTLQVTEYVQESPGVDVKIIKKVKGSDNVIPKAVFRHTLPDGTIEESVTAEDGTVIFTGLAYGEHTIEEVSVPDGYVINPGRIIFEVTKSNEIVLLTNTSEDETGSMVFEIQGDGSILLTVEDLLTPYSLIVQKVNEDDIFLQGAEFSVYLDEECSDLVETGNTDDNGKLMFKNLEVGRTYYIKETKAPQGYKLDKDNMYQIRVESDPTQNIFEYYLNEEKYVEGDGNQMITGTKSEREINLKIVNHSGIKMPATGTVAVLIPFISCLSMMLGISGRLLVKRKGRK